MTSTTWRPLLAGDLAREAHCVLIEIATDLRDRVSSPEAAGPASDFSLSRGDAGQALFFAYLDRALPGEGYDDLALELLDRAADTLASREVRPVLYAGFAGVGWVAEHLQGWLLEPGEDDPVAGIMAALENHLRQTPWRRHFDLIAGLVGLGALALERHPRSGAQECAELVVARLAELAEHQDEGLTWLTPAALLPPDVAAITPHGQYDLGVAHGVPGVIAFLAAAAVPPFSLAAARPLLDGAVHWLLDSKRPADGAVFPYHRALGSDLRGSRLAWCYGDPGISVVLLGAARRLGEPAWEREALEVARLAAVRRLPGSGVRDACLCHGAAGAGHLFNRLFQASGEPVFAEAARFWFEQTLTLRTPGQGSAGFLHWHMTDAREEQWLADPGLLMGSAGVGLALLSALYPVAPAWDRVMLAEIPA